MKRIAPPSQPAPDDFDLAYFVHCMGYIEQEKELAKRRAKRIFWLIVGLLWVCLCGFAIGAVLESAVAWMVTLVALAAGA